jgi:hypothetical protein
MSTKREENLESGIANLESAIPNSRFEISSGPGSKLDSRATTNKLYYMTADNNRSTFVLVEPLGLNGLVDRPNLGCAMLMAVCGKSGILARLIRGQTWYLPNLLLADSAELWHLIQDLKDEDLAGVGLKATVRTIDLDHFRSQLKALHQDYLDQRIPRNYLAAPLKMLEVSRWRETLVRVLLHYVERLHHDNLGIVERYAAEIVRSNPRYIGWSLQEKFDPLSRAIRRRLRQVTDAPIIAGGSLTPFIEPRYLDQVLAGEELDYLVVGPGEQALPALIEALESKREPAGIPNVFYRRNGQVQGNPLQAIDDLNALPCPDFTQFDLDSYPVPARVLPLQTARGCSWRKCAFCDYGPNTFGSYRAWNTDRVIETLGQLQRTFGASHFCFNDDDVHPERARKLSAAIVAAGLEVNLDFFARFEEGYNDDGLLDRMCRAGVASIHWGLESGNQRVLDLMNKGTNAVTASEILRKSSAHGISNSCFVIFGFPGETLPEARQTVEFLKQNQPYIDRVEAQPFGFSAFAPVSRHPEKWGVTAQANGGYAPPPGSLSPAEAASFARKFELRRMMGDLRVSSELGRFVLNVPCGTVRGLLFGSHRPLAAGEALDRLDRGEWQTLYPVLGGVIRSSFIVPRSSFPVVWQPVDFREDVLLQERKPHKEIPVGEIEERLIAASDGLLSVAEIIDREQGESGIGNRESGIGNRSEIPNSKFEISDLERALSFYQNSFQAGLALAFSKSWQLLEVRRE